MRAGLVVPHPRVPSADMDIAVVPYDPAWPAAFAAEEALSVTGWRGGSSPASTTSGRPLSRASRPSPSST